MDKIENMFYNTGGIETVDIINVQGALLYQSGWSKLDIDGYGRFAPNFC
jgi:hypothetical protein